MGSPLSRRETSSVQLALVTLVIVLAFGLRLSYAIRTNPFVDEFTSVWAGKLILQQGVPVTPAGVLYNRGLVFSYLEAISMALLGSSKLATRLPSIIVGVVSVALVFHVGKRLFSSPVGLFAAFLVAFSPDAIIWAGRARMYALLQLMVLLAVYFLYLGSVASRSRYLYAFAVCFWIAAFVHFEAILLYPAALLVLLVFQGRHWFSGRQGLMVNATSCLGMLAAYMVQKLGWSPDVELLGGAAGLDIGRLTLLWGGVSRHVGFFLQAENLPLAILFVLGLIYLFVRAAGVTTARRGSAGAVGEGGSRRRHLAFLYLIFCPVWLAVVTIGGVSYSNPRYASMILPLFLLISAAMMELLVRLLGAAWHARVANSRYSFRASFPSWVIGCLLAVVVGAVYLPSAISALDDQQPGYDHAVQYVRSRLRKGDAIMTLSPPVAAVHLGGCDYFAIQRRYEDRVVEKDGELVDMWTGAPLLNSVAELEAVLTQYERVWLFADSERMARRYNLDFLEYVVEQMEEIEEIEGVRVVLFKGLHVAEEPVVRRDVEVNFADEMALVGYGLNGDAFEPGGKVRLSLRWQGVTPMVKSYSVFVHLVDASNSLWAQSDAAPLRGLYPTTHWILGEIVPDIREITLPMEIPSGRYRLEVGVYQAENLEHLSVLDEGGNYLGDRIILDYLQIREQAPEPFSPQHLVNANLAYEIILQGYDLDTKIADAGDTVRLVVYWRAQREIEEDHTVFVHLIDDAGTIWGQRDTQPENGFYPTSFWDEAEVVRDEYEFTIDPDAPLGQYQVEVGMYVLATGERLSVVDENGDITGDRVLLASLEVRE